MAKPKYDFIIEAVHYGNGHIAWARGYRRRFVHYSDWEIHPRETIIQWLREGKRIAVGRRRPLQGNEFDILDEVVLVHRQGQPFLTTRKRPQAQRELEGTPIL